MKIPCSCNLCYHFDQQANVNRYELALDKVNEAFASIASYRGEIADLDPEYQLAKQRTRVILQEVEECEQIFAEVRREFGLGLHVGLG